MCVHADDDDPWSTFVKVVTLRLNLHLDNSKSQNFLGGGPPTPLDILVLLNKATLPKLNSIIDEEGWNVKVSHRGPLV